MAESQTPQQHLETIQTNVLDSLDVAADVMEILSAVDGRSNPELSQKCSAFLQKVAVSQASIRELVSGHNGTKALEQTPYYPLAEANITSAKAGIIADLLEKAISAAETTVSGATAADGGMGTGADSEMTDKDKVLGSGETQEVGEAMEEG